jgi:hypothetical protein
MIFDSALADAEIRGDNLTGLTGEYQFHDLPLSRSEGCLLVRGSLPPGGELSRIPRLFGRSPKAQQHV